MGLWERFDTLATPDEVANAKEEFTPLEAGTYKVILEELKPAETQTGLPKIEGKFRTLNNRVVFYNQILQNVNYPNMTAKNIAQAVDTLGALLGEELSYTNMTDLESKIYEVSLGTEYEIELTYRESNGRQYAQVKVLGKVQKDGFMNIPDGIDQELPFN